MTQLEDDYAAAFAPGEPFAQKVSAALLKRSLVELSSGVLATMTEPYTGQQKEYVKLINLAGTMRDSTTKAYGALMAIMRFLITAGIDNSSLDADIQTAVDTHFGNFAKLLADTS